MYDDNKRFNMRVEYDPTPVRHIAVQCPEYDRWFYGYDVVEKGSHLDYDYQLDSADFVCPICNIEFGSRSNYKYDITETDYPNVYEGCLQKTVEVRWE